MGIYIKGMEMPRFGECIVITSDSVASKYLDGDVAIYYDAHPEKASAVERPPHGRLIDADALWEKEKSERALKKHRPKGQSIIFDAGFLAGFRAAAQIASKMPTIIPADKEDTP